MDDFCFPETGEGRILLSDRMDSKGSGMEQLSGDLEEKVDTTLDYYADLSYFFGPDADSIQIDKIQYPDRKVVERCAMIRDFGDKTKEVLDIWSRIKGDNLGVGITILIFVVVALMSGWMIYKRWQRYSRRKQQNRRSRRKRKKNVKR